MRLNDPIVDSVEFEGVIYPLNLAFNRVLDVFDVLEDDVLTDFEKAYTAIAILTGREDVAFPTYVDLWLAIKEDYIDASQDEDKAYDLKGNPLPKPKSDENQKLLIDFKKDAEYIFASFLQAYGINLLYEQDKLTWSEFKALLNALPDNTIMQQIIDIRQWKPQKGETSEHRQKMRKLQRKYQLVDREEVDNG